MTQADKCYADKLVQLTPESIRFRWYYVPMVAKRVPLANVERLEVVPASLATGSCRIWGTGDFTTWFPCDWGRPFRKQIYLLYRRSANGRIGFTVQDDETFQQTCRGLGLTLETRSAQEVSQSHGLMSVYAPRMFTCLAVVLFLLAAISIGLGIPLVLGRVPPNESYGFRVPETLSNDQIWYAANRFCGYSVIVMGAVLAVPALIFAVKRRTLPRWIGIVILVLLQVLPAILLAANYIYLQWLVPT